MNIQQALHCSLWRFSGALFYFWGLFSAFRGQNLSKPPCVFFPWPWRTWCVTLQSSLSCKLKLWPFVPWSKWAINWSNSCQRKCWSQFYSLPVGRVMARAPWSTPCWGTRCCPRVSATPQTVSSVWRDARARKGTSSNQTANSSTTWQ